MFTSDPHPNKAVGLLGGQRIYACSRGNRLLLTQGGNVDTLSTVIVLPAVIRAGEMSILDPPTAELATAMGAACSPHHH